MNSIDMQASLNNLTHLERHQDEVHRGPVTHQAHNAQSYVQQARHSAQAPSQPQKSQGKGVDAREKGASANNQRRGKKRPPSRPEDTVRARRRSGGNFIDIDA
jgi:hypothetical protein